MKSYALLLGILILALVVWRITTNRRSTEPDIDVMMDRHADDAVKEANVKYSVVLDYSPKSVEKVDFILGKLHAQHVKQSFDDRALGRQARLWGAYLGAVVKRVHPGKWEIDSEAAGKGSLPLVFGTKDQTFPCTWTYKRIVNGDEDNVVHKFQILIIQRGKPLEGLTIPENSK